MDVSIKASGQPSKFDIFDSGLTLLALHSACLALAFTASENEAISKTFNLILMIAGFASGAVLAVLAAYYGTINAKALAPQLMGGAARPSEADPERVLEPVPEQNDVMAGRAAMSSDRGDLQLEPAIKTDRTPSFWAHPGRSTGIVAGVVLVLLALVATLLLQGVEDNNKQAKEAYFQAASDEWMAAAALDPIANERAERIAGANLQVAQSGAPMSARTRALLEKSPAHIEAEQELERTERVAALAKGDADPSSDRRRSWQAWLIIGLTALVLAPLPFAWTAPNSFVSTVRGLLVLGSLLAFVLGVGGALLPLAAQAVSKGVEQATETRVELPSAPDHPGGTSTSIQVNPGTPGTINVVQPGSATSVTGGITAAGVSPQHPDIEGIRTDIAQLKIDMTAALARPVQVRMDPPEIRFMGPTTTTDRELPPIELTVVGHEGDPGAPGAPGTPAPVRECGWSWTNFKENLWPRSCQWVAPPPVLPAPAPATSF